jgi:hypothetical protein
VSIKKGFVGLGAATVIALAGVSPAVAAGIAHRPATVATPAKKGKIVFSYGPHTGIPPAKLGPYTMKRIAADKPKKPAVVTSVKGPTGKVVFSESALHLRIGPGAEQWKTWSNGYKGSIYWIDYDQGGNTTVVLTLPRHTKAFYVYVEPNEFKTHDLSAIAQNGVTSGDTKVLGDAGAEYFGFYATGKQLLKKITITCNDDFALGEFGIAK